MGFTNFSLPKKMKLISVAGTSSNVGKTAVCESLIRYLSDPGSKTDNMDNTFVTGNVSALKITTRHQGFCSKGSCGVCDSIKYPFVIVEDDPTINQEGKDTARLKNAGARKVVWLLSFPETLAEGVSAALDYFDTDETVVIEGNSILSVHNVDLAIMVTRPPQKDIKKSASKIFQKIDTVIINKDNTTSSQQIKDSRDWLKEIGLNSLLVEMNPYEYDPILLQGRLFKLG